MKINKKNKKKYITYGSIAAVVLVGGFFAWKKGLITRALSLFKKKRNGAIKEL